VGTISNIMQSISASQERSGAREVRLDAHRTLLPEEHFRRVLCAEKKRSERLSKHMILMQVSSDCAQCDGATVLSKLGLTLGSLIRETDVTGWLETNSSLGVIFTELGDCEDVSRAERIIRERIAGFLVAQTSRGESRIQISFKSFCDEWTEKAPASTAAKSAIPPTKFALRGYPNQMRRPVVDSSNGVL
jgi:hypothetical protein